MPLVALVDGVGITKDEFQAELDRYRAADVDSSVDDPQRYVLEEMIDEALLAQAAAEAGFIMDEALVQQRIDQLASRAGGTDVLADWLAQHGYSEPAFRLAISRAAAAAWMRDEIASAVPQAIEQVHARQILLYNLDQANQALTQIQTGTSFASLASRHDPVMSGDLGWFPRGYLDEPALDEAAFGLQPGEMSGIIETSLGFHILQVIEREPRRQLDPDARLVLQMKALRDWLEARRSQVEVQILLP